MSVLPSKMTERIRFCQEHTPVWSLVADEIGTTTAAVTALGTKTTAANAALLDQGEKQDAAMAATNALHLADAAMTDAVADILKAIKAKAAVAGDGIYSLAQIPAPALPSPKAPPGKPYELKVSLDGSGALNLKWKCANPAGTSGTMYQVWRRVGSAAEFTFIGGSGRRSFVDATLPAGAATVVYQIQAVRSTVVGEYAQFVINFGTGAAGSMTASVLAPSRMAA